MNPLIMHIPSAKPLSYPIRLESGLLRHPQIWLSSKAAQQKIVIITDDNLKRNFGIPLAQTLQKNGLESLLLSFPAGEKAKRHFTKQTLEEQMLLHHCDRKTLILALGGGVVGDLAGFVAATYMRGIAYIQLPTTLLAMVDSSIGGKTGIDTDQGKNLIGAFWQPQAVIADLNCLNSLPPAQLAEGIIEAVKMFLTHDPASFFSTDNTIASLLHHDLPALKTLIHQAIKIKIAIVSRDENENNERMVLNFGHTIGQAIEHLSAYTISHGRAVALGILVEAKISQLQGLLSTEEYNSIQNFFGRLNVSGNELRQFPSDAVIQATRIDKKAQASKARYVLLEKIGKVYETEGHFAHIVADHWVEKAIKTVSEVNNDR